MIYSVILKNTTAIAEFSEEGEGDFLELLTKYYKANKQIVEFYVLPYQSYEFCFLQSKEYTFAGITKENTGKYIIISINRSRKGPIFLTIIKEKFLWNFIKRKPYFSINLDIKRANGILLYYKFQARFRDSLSINKFSLIEKELEDIKNCKIDIIDKTIKNSMIVDSLIPKCENLKIQVYYNE